jgi:hypothetical protein
MWRRVDSPAPDMKPGSTGAFPFPREGEKPRPDLGEAAGGECLAEVGGTVPRELVRRREMREEALDMAEAAFVRRG